ncbi:acyltransferase domain-containing protein [Virgisporangium aurantiacum]|uniref:acyltransferase domain-containing protein n=1 Tax=Virgisporangium aurantiacum TaxID=175570 RepID=UPI00194E8628|nr:acyltransferase domain-containing protein [Virgisporangium aurantiacum]
MEDPLDTTLLFPGQGDFDIRALTTAAASYPAVCEAVELVFEQVDAVGREHGVGPVRPWLEVGAGGLHEASLEVSLLVQYGSSVAVHAALCSVGRAPDRVLAVSFGELPALAATGAVTIADGARLTVHLARTLRRCVGGLTALGAGEARAGELLRAADADDVVVACVNDDASTVVAGPVEQLSAVERLAAGLGLRSARLPLPFTSHHPGLAPRAAELLTAIRDIPIDHPRVPLYSAVAGRSYRSTDDLHGALVDGLVRPARVPDVLRQVAVDGAVFLDAGTGRSLLRSVRRVLGPVTAHPTLAEPAIFSTPSPATVAVPVRGRP